MHNILIVDDEKSILESLKGVLEDEGYAATTSGTAESGLDLLRDRPFDVVLLDIWLPGMDGLEALSEIKKLDGSPEVIMISGHGTIETAVRATKLGAYDFIEKPLSLDRTLLVIKNALRQRQLERDNAALRDALARDYVMVGDSVPMRALRQQITIVAPTNGRVLISGE